MPRHSHGRRITLGMTLLTIILTAKAYAAVMTPAGEWMAIGNAQKGQTYWLRNEFPTPDYPDRTFITVTTADLYDLYVNGVNVSTATILPLRKTGKRLIARTFEITHLIIPGNNIIGIWTAPTSGQDTIGKIAVTLRGTDETGKHWSLASIQGWTARPAPRWIDTEGKEWQDGQIPTDTWNTTGHDIALWMPTATTTPPQETVTASIPWDGDMRLAAIHTPQETIGTRDTINAIFGRYIDARARLTFRGLTPGDTIRAGNIIYIARGENDEQAFMKFTHTITDRIPIRLPHHLEKSVIQKIELLEELSK